MDKKVTEQDGISESEAMDVVSDNVNQTGTMQVFDADSGETVAVSAEMRSLAFGLQQRLDATTLVTALILKKVSDEKLYLAFDCSSFKEYAETMLPFGYSSSKKYLIIGNKFAPMLPEFDSKGDSNHLLESENVAELSGLGYSKLYELTKVEDADFSEVMTEGKLVMPDGSELTLDDLRDMSARDVIEEVRKVRAPLQKEVRKYKEDALTAQAERDQYKSQLEKNKKLIERADELEKLYGEEAVRIGEIEENIRKADSYLRECEKYFNRIVIDDEDPESVKEQTLSLIRRATRIITSAYQNYDWITETAEHQVFPTAVPVADMSKVKDLVEDMKEN
ncbi:MAG: hypothetical protein RIC57_09095 [Balneola sp.]